MAADRRRGPARHRDQRQRRVRLPRRRPVDDAPRVRGRPGPRREHRRARRLPRPGRLRAALRRRAPDELPDDVVYQLAALVGTAPRSARGSATSSRTGRCTTRSSPTGSRRPRWSRRSRPSTGRLPLVGLPGSAVLELAAEAGLARSPRRSPTGPTRPRARWSAAALPGSVLHDVDDVVARCVAMATGGTVDRRRRRPLRVSARSLCVHGDTPGAVAVARAVRAGLEGAGRPRGGVRLMRVLPAGQRGACSSRSTTSPRCWPWPRTCAPHPLPGVVDLVPAARTVLLVLDPAAVTPARPPPRSPRCRPTCSAPASPARRPRRRRSTVPVVYDGEDLAEVGRLTGWGADGVVARHTATTWTVAFSGFAPGLRLLRRRRRARLAGAPARDPAHPRARRVRRARRRLDRRLPDGVPGRLAAARPHDRGRVGPRPGPARAAAAGGPGPLRRGDGAAR